MKAVLVIDIPEDCISCPCVNPELWNCQASKEYIEAEYKTRPERCPLRPVPEKGKMDNIGSYAYNEGFADGKNYCIDLIAGKNRISDTEKLIQEMIKASNGKSNYDVGLRNGMRLVLSMITNDEEPEFERTREQNELL